MDCKTMHANGEAGAVLPGEPGTRDVMAVTLSGGPVKDCIQRMEPYGFHVKGYDTEWSI